MPASLTEALRRVFRTDGIAFPIPVLSPEETQSCRDASDDLEARLGGKPRTVEVRQMHLHLRWAYDLATHPRRSHRARNVALATAAAVAAGAAYARLRPAPLPDLVFEETDVVSATAGP